MEGRGKVAGFGFPGYDGCFPKATRSSRGRGGDHGLRKTVEANDLRKGMCVFELLATVAGQLLQEQDEQGLTARSLNDLEVPKPNVDSAVEKSDIITSCHIQAKNMDVDEAKPQNQVAHKPEEPSAISCISNLDPSMIQEHNSTQATPPIKAYSSRKRENSQVCSSKGIGMLVRKEDGEVIKGVKVTEMHISSTLNSGDTNIADKTSYGEQSHLTSATRHCNDLDLLLNGAFQLDVESPPLVSSGSSEETMEPKSCLAMVYESSRQSLTGKEDFCPWKPRDDDGNSSESTVPQNFLAKSPSISYMRAVKMRRSGNGPSTKNGACRSIGSKRKRHDFDDGEFKKDDRNGGKGRKRVKRIPSIKDGIEHLNPPPNPPPFGVYGFPELVEKVNLSRTKMERERSSGPASSISSPSNVADNTVKLSIKSFMVPELMVDLPESATIANLKKAVMEAAMNLLGGGLCVRVLYQGKRVTDETESLLQAGISCSGKMDSLGFMLEPNPMPAAASAKDTFVVHASQGGNQTPSRFPVVSKGSEVNMGGFPTNTHDRMLEIVANNSGTEMQSTMGSPSKGAANVQDSNGIVVSGSCALVLHSSGSNGSAVVPFGQGLGNVGTNKRRIRRPFSVAEVEVLVQAVEKLGTGRWRDVKLHAFPQAKHRTYVDLKDKWKTLVHTASIAPHQRRGEPVPQGLLDRVIQAHSYWTAQQAKQQSMETKVVC